MAVLVVDFLYGISSTARQQSPCRGLLVFYVRLLRWEECPRCLSWEAWEQTCELQTWELPLAVVSLPAVSKVGFYF